MTLRAAAALSLVLGAAALLFFLRLLGEGPLVPPEMRHLREMKNRVTAPAAVESSSFAGMIALPHRRPLAEYAPIERRGVALEGYVQRMLRASDGDVHLEIVARRPPPSGWDTVYVSAEITPRVRRGAPRWTWENLVEAFRPMAGGATPWNGGPRRVRIRGWLMYDWQYDEVNPRHVERLSGWEIHPVTGIEIWDEATARFVGVPR